MKLLKTKLIEYLLDEYSLEEAEKYINEAVIIIKGSFLYVCYSTGNVDTYTFDNEDTMMFVS